jgi:hypothetical protein
MVTELKRRADVANDYWPEDKACLYSSSKKISGYESKSDELDSRAIPTSGGERRITGQQGCPKCFGERDVSDVISGDIVTKFPDPRQKKIMRVTGQRKIDKILKRLKPSSGIKLTGSRVSAKNLRDFDIEEVGCVKGFVGIEKPFGYPNSGTSIQQHLNHDRGIDNDHLPSRSALTALVGEIVGVIEVRWARRLLNSAIVCRSAARRTS